MSDKVKLYKLAVTTVYPELETEDNHYCISVFYNENDYKVIWDNAVCVIKKYNTNLHEDDLKYKTHKKAKLFVLINDRWQLIKTIEWTCKVTEIPEEDYDKHDD